LNIEKLEKILYSYWSPYIEEPEKIVVDATCYESELRYPTDQKLLWESLQWMYKQLGQLCKVLGVKMPRSKYLKWKKRYIGYSRLNMIELLDLYWALIEVVKKQDCYVLESFFL